MVDLITLQNVTSISSSSLMWMRVGTQTIGFALIAVSYLIAGKIQGTSRRSYSIIFTGTIISILATYGLLSVFFSSQELASVYSYTDLFSIVNLILLSYIILFICRKIQLTDASLKSQISAPLAFTLLWIGQLSFLVWPLSGNNTVFLIGSQLFRLIGLALFIQICYSASREVPTNDFDQAK
jgi:hypothetical protein